MANLKSLIAKLSPPSRRVLEAAANVALSRTHHEVDIEHVLLELLSQGDGDLPPMLRALGVAESRLREELMGGLARLRSGNTRNPVLSERIPRWLEASWLIASVDFGATQLRGGFLLLGLLATPIGFIAFDPIEITRAMTIIKK